MRKWQYRVRYSVLTVAATGLFAFNGCGLSDQQLAQIWSSVLQSGLNTVISSVISSFFTAASGTA
jgi:hypothetical protein